jgi:hypothetical protein
MEAGMTKFKILLDGRWYSTVIAESQTDARESWCNTHREIDRSRIKAAPVPGAMVLKW